MGDEDRTVQRIEPLPEKMITVPASERLRRRVSDMNEKEMTYKTMTSAGVASLVVGIIVVVTGISAGVMSIVSGARLLKRKNSVMI